MYNIYLILNRQNGHKYLGSDTRSLNKVWKEIRSKYESWNEPLYNTMKYYGVEAFTIRIVEEVHERDLDKRLRYWAERYQPEYNKSVIPHESRVVDNKGSYKRGERKWGYQRKHKKNKKENKNVIKCRNVKTGKLKTLHGWDAAAKFCGGYVANIKRAIKNNGTAYGYKWWVYKKVEIKRSVYGVHKDGSVTQIFDTISAAMRAFGEEDRGKGICTSIKWGSRWKGYLWYYCDSDDIAS